MNMWHRRREASVPVDATLAEQTSARRREAEERPEALAATVQSDLVLIIDDSITVRAILETNLNRAGYRCLSFMDGVSALDWLWREAARLPRLVLLDPGLPGLDGYEVARAIRANPRWNAMGIVLLTSQDQVPAGLKEHGAGVQAYLAKPFRIEHLLTVVQGVLNGEQSLAHGGPPECPGAQGI